MTLRIIALLILSTLSVNASDLADKSELYEGKEYKNAFANPAELFVTPDHYLFRMLYSQGVRLEDLVAEMTPKGRQLVPDAVKRELLAKIKDFLAQQQNI